MRSPLRLLGPSPRLLLGALSVVALGCTVVACDDSGPEDGSSSSSGAGGDMSTTTTDASSSSGMQQGIVGLPCVSDAECGGGMCLTQPDTGFPMGYCTQPCMDDSDCDGNYCFSNVCFKNCGTDACRAGYECVDVNEDGSVLACSPNCMANTDCAAPAQCVTDQDDPALGLCAEDENCTDAKDNDLDGLADCPDTDCAADATCQQAITAACTAAPTATPTQSGDTNAGTNLFVGTCAGFLGDFTTGYGVEDVYTFTTPTAGELHIEAKAIAGDLALYVRKDCDDPMSQVACADNEVDPNTSEVVDLVVAAGDTYSIYVDAYDAASQGNYDLAVAYEPAVCGDGNTTLPEECDDTNTANGDGCSSACVVEDAFVCAAATPVLNATPIMGDTSTTSNGFAPTNMGAVQDCFPGAGAGNEKVFIYTPTQNGDIEIRLTSPTDQGVYTRATCTDPMTEGVCEDAQAGGVDERVVTAAVIGVPVYVFVDAFAGEQENGPFTLRVDPVVCGDGIQASSEECDDSNTMNNDGCSSTCEVEAAFICMNAPLIGLGMTSGDTSMGTSSFEAPADMAQCADGAGSGREALYRYTPAASGMLTLTLTSGSQDLGIYVRTTCLTAGTQIGCAEEAFTGMAQTETLQVPVTANNTITIFVDGFNSAAGPFTLTLAQ